MNGIPQTNAAVAATPENAVRNSNKMHWYFVALTISGVVGVVVVGIGTIGFFAYQGMLPAWLAKLNTLGALGPYGSSAMIAGGGILILGGSRGVIGLIFPRDLNNSRLITDYPSGCLSYETWKEPEVGCLEDLGCYAFATVMWPLVALVAPLFCLYSSIGYGRQLWKQKKLVRKLGSEEGLKSFIEQKKIKTLRKCLSFSDKASKIITQFQKAGRNLAIPVLTYPPTASNEEIVTACISFMESFVHVDISNVPDLNKKQKADLKNLQALQTCLRCLIYRFGELKDSQKINRIAAIKNIAIYSLVKINFRKERCKEIGIMGLCFMVPTGFFYFLVHNPMTKDQKKFENNKEHLPKIPELGNYSDVVDVHNSLLTTYNYLIPYAPLY